MQTNKTYEKEHFKLNLARIKKEGQNFEINIDPDLAIAMKEGQNIAISEILKSEHIFFDAREGELASQEMMKTIFGTDDVLKVAKKILDDGEIQLTAEHRQKVRDRKQKKLVSMIHRNAIDPRSGLPHPVQRIENALNEAKIKINEIGKVEDQLQDILKKLQPIIPIKFERKQIEVKIGPEHAHSMYTIATKYGSIKENQWLNDGSWFGVIEIPAGLRNEFLDELNNITHGNAIIKMLE